MSTLHLGIDLGGAKIEGVVISSTPQFEIMARHRVPTNQELGYYHIVQQIGLLVDYLQKQVDYQFDTIGIGTPGTLDPITHCLKNSNTVCLNGNPFQKDLATALKKNVNMANDANCFVLAETRYGIVQEKAPDAHVVFGVIMGTGVGGGLVIDHQIVRGRHGIGGEWGHNFLDDSGGECYCGRVGCVETVISGPALERYYWQASKTKRPLPEIVSRSKDGSDIIAMRTMQRLYAMFGKGISTITNIIDPDVIVIGGGVGNIDELYTQGKYELKKYIFNPDVETLLLKPKLGDSAGVIGAALL